MTKPNKHQMIMQTPACKWQDASPTGNGTLGAMMYGQICQDTILLNHEALFYPGTKPPQVDLSDLLPELRKLICEGRCKEAEELLPNAYKQRCSKTGIDTIENNIDPYQPFADFCLQTETDGPFKHYRRGVDFDSGRIWLQWQDQSSENLREMFVSRLDNTVYLRLKSSKEKAVSYSFHLQKHDPDSAKDHPSATQMEEALYETSSESEGFIKFTGTYNGAYSFGALALVTTSGGSKRNHEDQLQVENADEIIKAIETLGPDASGIRITAPKTMSAEWWQHAGKKTHSIHLINYDLENKARDIQIQVKLTGKQSRSAQIKPKYGSEDLMVHLY